MHHLALKLAMVGCVAFTLLRAEELPVQRSSKPGPAISVRPLKRLFFEDNLNLIPGGGILPATFAFLRSGETNISLTVYFILTGTAELEADYTRVSFSSLDDPRTITNGEVQSVIFAPGDRIQFAHFRIIVDGVRERAEYIRVKIPEPIQNGFAPPEYHLGARACATIWISNQKRCDRVAPTPGGGQTCVERRSVLPRAYFRAPSCVDKPFPLPGTEASGVDKNSLPASRARKYAEQ
jgi:hypothetical protein